MDIMQYQYVWHKADKVFNPKILMSKMHLALIDHTRNHGKINEKVDEIIEKIE